MLNGIAVAHNLNSDSRPCPIWLSESNPHRKLEDQKPKLFDVFCWG